MPASVLPCQACSNMPASGTQLASHARCHLAWLGGKPERAQTAAAGARRHLGMYRRLGGLSHLERTAALTAGRPACLAEECLVSGAAQAGQQPAQDGRAQARAQPQHAGRGQLQGAGRRPRDTQVRASCQPSALTSWQRARCLDRQRCQGKRRQPGSCLQAWSMQWWCWLALRPTLLTAERRAQCAGGQQWPGGCQVHTLHP